MMEITMDRETFRQGYLQKKKAVAKSVKKRWFSLNSDAFFTYRSEEGARVNKECLEVLPLVEIQTVKKQNTGNHRFPFEIITRSKTLIFLTESAYEQDQWVKAFHAAMQLRRFNNQRDDNISNKYVANNTKDKRSSTGPRKLSQVKKMVQEGFKTGHRKSSGVDCDPSEAEYQGIPIGNIDNINDEVFDNQRPAPPADTCPVPTSDHYEAVQTGTLESSISRAHSRDSEDSGQGTHDARNMDSSATRRTETQATNSVSNGTSSHSSSGSESAISSAMSSLRMSPPPPVPASSRRSASPMRLLDDDQIYDEPPRHDEDIYDVPPREYEEEYYEEESSPKLTAMSELQRIIDAEIDANNERELALAMSAAGSSSGGYESDYDNAPAYDEGESLEATLAEQGVSKSAMDELKDLLDTFDEL